MTLPTIDWVTFIPGAVLLLSPAALFEGSKIKHRESDREWTDHTRKIARVWIHYADLVRAALGTWLVLQSIHATPGARGLAKQAVLLIPVLLTVAAVTVQTLVSRAPDFFNAPFAFVTGLVLGGHSPIGGALAIGLAIALAMGARTPNAYFPLLALAYAGFSAGLGGKGMIVKTSGIAAAILIPWLLSLLFHRAMVISYRSGSTRVMLPPPR